MVDEWPLKKETFIDQEGRGESTSTYILLGGK